MRETCCCFELEFEESEDLALCFGEVIEIDHDYDPYEGPYEVTPIFEEVILATKGKNMEDDVTVHEIPVVKVDNPGGGNTVTIGG